MEMQPDVRGIPAKDLADEPGLDNRIEAVTI
jgi:hypothetical protein